MAGRDLNDDDVLQAALGQALDAVESGSSSAEQLARSAVELGRIDVELAELVSDSYLDVGSALAVRATGVEEGRMLTFTGNGLTLDLDLPTAAETVLGQVEVDDERRPRRGDGRRRVGGRAHVAAGRRARPVPGRAGSGADPCRPRGRRTHARHAVDHALTSAA